MASVVIQISANASSAYQTIRDLENRLRGLDTQFNIGGNGRGGNGGGGTNGIDEQAQRAAAGAAMMNNAFMALSNTLTRNFVSAMKSAVSEMKKVDDELVTVRKVTNRTAQEMAATESKAYDVGKKYGVAAHEYLSSVSTFARAGYKDQSEALAELSTRLQLAGDMTATISDKFLTAVDNAYQFGGSIEKLSAVMDGINAIENHFPTSISEIASGIGKVASIAASTHTGIDELSAAIGTISAVTQRSGTEAATALRALFLNIIGDTKTEIADGATWTAGEIEGLRDVLKIYAKDVVEAADATGTVIKPMEAIGALAHAFKEGTLSEAKLMSMVSDIGGKLRSNQLLILLQHWDDIYQPMLNTFTNGVGSIEQEIDVLMNSWSVKVEQIKTSWTELVADSLNGGMIKSGLDTVLNIVNAFGSLENVVLGLGGALLALNSGRIMGGLRNIVAMIGSGGGIGIGTGILGGIGIGALAVSAVTTGFNMARNEMDKQAAEYAKHAQETIAKEKNIVNLYVDFSNAVPGTQAYTNALNELTAALENVSGASIGAGQSIAGFTADVLQSQYATAKADYDKFAKSLRDGLFLGVGSHESEIVSRIEDLYETAAHKMAGKGAEAEMILRGLTGWASLREMEDPIESVITAYEMLNGLKKEMEAQAAASGGSVTGYKLYSQIDDELKAQAEIYKNAVEMAKASGQNNALFQIFGAISSGNVKDVEAFDAAIANMVKNMDGLGGTAKKFALGTVLEMMGQLFPELASASEAYAQAMADAKEAGVEFNTGNAVTEAENLAIALTNAAKAKAAFDAAMESETENTGFQTDKEIYTQWEEEYKAGRVNSRALRAAAKNLLGESAYNELYASGGMAAVNAAISKSNYGAMYGADADYEYEEYGERTIATIRALADAQGNIKNANGDILASFKEVDGVLQYSINDYYGLWQMMGHGEETIGKLGNALLAFAVYGKQTLDPDAMQMFDAFKQMQDVMLGGDELGEIAINYNTLLGQLTPDVSEDQFGTWVEMLHTFSELGFIQIEGATEGWWKEDVWKQAYEDAVKAKGAAEEAGETTASAHGEAKKAAEEASEAAEEASEAIDSVDPAKITEGLHAAVEAARAAGAEVKETADGISDVKFDDKSAEQAAGLLALIGQAQEAEKAVQAVQAVLATLNGPYTAQFSFQNNSEGELDGVSLTVTSLDGKTTTTYFFDENGQLTTMTSVTDGINGLREASTVYEFDPTNKRSKITTTKTDLDTLDTETTVYEFDEAGNRTKITTTRQNLNGLAIAHTEYTFNGDGGIATITTVETDINGLATATTTYTFDDQGNISTIEEVQGDLNGLTEAHTTYTFYPDGTVKKKVETINSETGEIISERETDYDLESDPDGIRDKVEDINAEVEQIDGEAKTVAEFDPNLGKIIYGVEQVNATTAEVEDAEATVIFDPNLQALQATVDDVNGILAQVGVGTSNAMIEIGNTLFGTNVPKIPSTAGVPGRNTEHNQAAFGMLFDALFKRGGGRKTTAEEPVQIEIDDNDRALLEALGFMPGKAEGMTKKDITLEIGASGQTTEMVFDYMRAGEHGESIPVHVSIVTDENGSTITETSLDENGNTISKTYKVDTSGAIESLEEVQQALDEVEENPAEAVVEADTSGAAGKINGIATALENLDGKEATVTIVTESKVKGTHTGQLGASNKASVSKSSALDNLLMYTNAGGADKFRGGLSLINEEGAELVAYGGMARILGGGRPVIANIPSGATIYTASETAALLNGIHTFAGGLSQSVSASILGGKKEEEEKKKTEEKKTASGGNEPLPEGDWFGTNGVSRTDREAASSNSDKKDEFWDTIKEYISYGLQKIEDAIQERKLSIDALEKAKSVLLEPIDDEIESIEYAIKLIDYEITLLERKRDDAIKPLDEEIERLKEQKELMQEQETEEERLKALEEARSALEEARHQRTVRVFNEEKGQWEWIADQKAIESAEEKLKQEEKRWEEYQIDKQISDLERQKKAIEQEFEDATAGFDAKRLEMDRRREDLQHQRDIVDHEYAEAEKPISDEMNELEGMLDQLKWYYEKLQHAVEIPTESLEKALQEMSKAEARFKAQFENTQAFTDLLGTTAGGWGAWPLELIGSGVASGTVSNMPTTIVNEGDVIIDGITLGAEAKSMTLEEVLKLAGVYGA